MNNNLPKVIFRCVAHNSEKTIARAMDSVLAQTYTNLELHVGIRASTDSTADIAKKYAKKDPRVRVIINKQAFEYDEGNDITDYYHEYDVEKDYVCFMDGDDEYKPDFLEKMVPFALENNLDIAACGFDVVDVKTGKMVDLLKPEGEIFIEGELFGTLLPKYYRYMRTRWAKIFRLAVTARLDRSRIFWTYYCDDTIEATEYFRNAERVGLYPETYYKWYRSSQSLSFRWDERRIESDRVVYDIVVAYIQDKVGSVSHENTEYLLEVYLVAIISTLRVVQNSQISVAEKFDATYQILTCEHTRKLAEISFKFNSIREKMFQDAVRWIAETGEFRNAAYYDKIAEIFFVTKTLPQSFPGWSETEIIGLLETFSSKYGN